MKLLIPLALLVAHTCDAQATDDKARKQLEYTRAHYTKYDYRIPMRDGVRLFTSLYVPKDRSQTYPILMQRTPYSVAPYGVDNYRAVLGPSEVFTKDTFIFAYQDVRGRYLSEGAFIDVPPHKQTGVDESTDTYDTVDWLVKNAPNNNSRVGIWGISYPGFFAAYSLIGSHPALKAVSPQAPMGDVGNGDDAYHNGAFFLAANFGFYSSFKPRPGEPARPSRTLPFDFGTSDAYDFYLQMGPLSNANEKYLKNENPYFTDLLKHPNYDEFWQARALAPYLNHITPAVMFVGGWFDAEDLAGPLKLFRAVERSETKSADTLVMGPWLHGGWARMDGDKLGNLDFGSKTGDYFREHIELPFFVSNLKQKGDGLKATPSGEIPKAWLFETGTNQWRRFDSWPPKEAKARSLYLNEGGKLSFDAPRSEGGFTEYVSDPNHPVPSIGFIGEGMPGDYMTEDQRYASTRPDVLTYRTEPLERDITIAGPITPALRVSTSGTDSDFIVKLIDVYPSDFPDPKPNAAKVHMGGYQQLVRGEPMRGKFRKSATSPEPFTPGKPESIQFNIPDVCHTFRTGHRIMVQVQSSWFPLIDRNPQVFRDIPTAKAADFRKATQRVYSGSSLRVMLLDSK